MTTMAAVKLALELCRSNLQTVACSLLNYIDTGNANIVHPKSMQSFSHFNLY